MDKNNFQLDQDTLPTASRVRAQVSEIELTNYRISGKAIVFEEEGVVFDWGDFQYREIISKGALDQTDLSDVALLIGHDRASIPLARYRQNGSSTMAIYVREDGLYFDADLDKDNPKVRELESALERGDINQMSFGFMIAEDGEYLEERGEDFARFRVTNIQRVSEISIVTSPAYNGAYVEPQEMERMRELYQANLLEEKALEIELKQLKELEKEKLRELMSIKEKQQIIGGLKKCQKKKL